MKANLGQFQVVSKGKYTGKLAQATTKHQHMATHLSVGVGSLNLEFERVQVKKVGKVVTEATYYNRTTDRTIILT